jgi:hypothetical protein
MSYLDVTLDRLGHDRGFEGHHQGKDFAEDVEIVLLNFGQPTVNIRMQHDLH